MVRWLVDVEVQPADEPPFAAGCDLSLLDAYSVSPGEPVTVAYHAESKRCDHIVDVEDQRRGGKPVAAAHGLRATRRSAAVSDPALLIYDPNDAASRSVVLSDWAGRGDLAGLERSWLSRRQLLAARPAVF